MAFVVGMQAICAALVVMVALLFSREAALSAAFGAVAVLVPNVLFATYLKLNGKPSVARLFAGEAIKLMLVLALSYTAWHVAEFKVNALSYWVALVVVLKAHNFGLLRTTKSFNSKK